MLRERLSICDCIYAFTQRTHVIRNNLCCLGRIKTSLINNWSKLDTSRCYVVYFVKFMFYQCYKTWLAGCLLVLFCHKVIFYKISPKKRLEFSEIIRGSVCCSFTNCFSNPIFNHSITRINMISRVTFKACSIIFSVCDI